MKTSLILLLALCLFAGGVIVGCGNGDESDTVKTMDEYRQEAADSITEDNAEAELERLEGEIEQDAP